MSKFMTRAIKYGYLKRTRGKAAADRYMESCFAYDSMHVVGIKGTSAWIIRQEQLRKRREASGNKAMASVREVRKRGRFWRPLACWAVLIFLASHNAWLAMIFLTLGLLPKQK